MLALIAALLPATARAGVGDPKLGTDDPYYPGELALATPRAAVEAALATPRGALGDTPRDRLIKLFLWRAEHFAHLESPAIYNLPGAEPDPQMDDHTLADFDAMRVLFNYGWGLCGNNHAQMRVFADVLGWPSRRRVLNGDAALEIFVDGGWRYVNTDQYTLHFLRDDPSAHLASIDEVITAPHHYMEWNPDVGLGHPLPQANTHGHYEDYGGVTRAVPNRSLQWRSYYETVYEIAPEDSTALYGEGYAAEPMVYELRRGETFTRWFDPQGAVAALGLEGPIWWGYNGGDVAGTGDNAPAVRYSFVQNAPARDEVPGGEEESRGVQRYGNGVFVWAPDLARGEHLDGTARLEGALVAADDPRGALRATSPARLTLLHASPYTIAARPLDGRDPAHPAVDGAVLRADAQGSLDVEVSIDGGTTWTSAGSISGPSAELDFTELVKARNQYLLRLSLDAGESLSRLELRTITMLSQAAYPNLKAGRTSVRYSATDLAALDYSPDLARPEAEEGSEALVKKISDSGNLEATRYSTGDTTAYQANDLEPITLVYALDLPPALAERGARFAQVSAAADFTVFLPASGAASARIEVAPAPFGPWTELAAYAPPADSALGHAWVYGASPEGMPLGGTRQYVRFTASDPGHVQGLRFLKIYATHQTPKAATDLEVTYLWSDGAERKDVHTLLAGTARDAWTIETGALERQIAVKLSASSGRSDDKTPPPVQADPAPTPAPVGATPGSGSSQPRAHEGACACVEARTSSGAWTALFGAITLAAPRKRPRRRPCARRRAGAR